MDISDDGPDRSLLSVETADRPGLLVDLVKIFTDINVVVESGEFDTEVVANSLRYFLRRPTTEVNLGHSSFPTLPTYLTRGKDSQGEEVIKPYTPTTLDTDVGYFALVIKMYPQGRMSHHFREMREGDYMAVTGPKGSFRYQSGQVRAFEMIAGGLVARAVLENPSDKTKVHLIYANVTSDDILFKATLQEELEGLAANYPDCFKKLLNGIYILPSLLPLFPVFALLDSVILSLEVRFLHRP
ncbi:hypothetical protein L2E82_37393 [Cichorium intybus]|uniref:Uncharacterized protein n=1 Tax=Cichorium intybus TaxID=13427 RepID=A0ACB9AFS7_CICIN|nr:hypothetical protein L2E82_37393 [Cichorium intybus]